MKISVELFGQLSLASPRRQILDLVDGATVQDAALKLGLNTEEVGIITINGVQSDMQDPLTPECRLCFFPYISGG
ncbi:MAG: MoaD/ThiS family protein [Acidobacteriaceae bacterium]